MNRWFDCRSDLLRREKVEHLQINPKHSLMFAEYGLVQIIHKFFIHFLAEYFIFI